MTKVSVIIPCFNYARFLPDAVESVLRQTYRDFEIIIVNDGSTDETREVAEGLIARYPDTRIALINQENQGLPASRNNGIRESAGEYILPLDADDMIEPGYMDETVRVLDADPAVAVAFTDARIVGETSENGLVWEYRDFDPKEILEANRIPVCSLFRKSAWEEAGGYKLLPGYADWEFWITFAELGLSARAVGKPLFLYRKHGASMVDRSASIHEELCSQIRGLHPNLYNATALEHILRVRERQIRELKEYYGREMVRMSEFIDDMHTFRGFVTRALKAALRRIGVTE